MADWAEWFDAEEDVRNHLAEGLAESLAVTAQVEDLAFELMKAGATPGADPHILMVHANLLTRALQDLRVCAWAAERGYTMQSWTLASSCMEAAYAIGYVGSSSDRARQWREHNDPLRSPWNVFDCILHTHRFLHIETDPDRLQQRVREEYRLYQHLCMAKHVNPIAERNRYLESQTGRFYLTPAFSTNMPQEARLGLALAARSTTVGIWAFRKTHFPQDHSLDARIVDTARRGLGLIRTWQRDVENQAGSESVQGESAEPESGTVV